MRPKLIVTDLDRTLLRDDRTISHYSAQTLRICRENDIKLMFATARPLRSVAAFRKAVAVNALAVHNGAVVCADGGFDSKKSIDVHLRDRVLEALLRENPEAALAVEIDDNNYANYDISADQWGHAIMTDFKDLPHKPADKIIARLTRAEEADMYAEHLPDSLYIQVSEGWLGLVMDRQATKWNAVRAVADHFGIAKNEIVAFGDDHNDVEMLHNCGTGVAVANAIDEAKAVADFVCDTNQTDGVARWIHENILR